MTVQHADSAQARPALTINSSMRRAGHARAANSATPPERRSWPADHSMRTIDLCMSARRIRSPLAACACARQATTRSRCPSTSERSRTTSSAPDRLSKVCTSGKAARNNGGPSTLTAISATAVATSQRASRPGCAVRGRRLSAPSTITSRPGRAAGSRTSGTPRQSPPAAAGRRNCAAIQSWRGRPRWP